MSHLAYVTAAYAATLAVVAGLGLWLVLDGRARRRELAELEARGIRRRSAREQA